jgi:cobalt-zinc-cadmium efflux system membrane fusion protein
MTDTTADQPHSPPPPRAADATPPPPRRATWRERASLGAQMVISLAVAGAALVYLLRPGTPPPPPASRPADADPVARVSGRLTLKVRPGTPLDDKLYTALVEPRTTTAPIFTVTGRTLASLRPGPDGTRDAWQFATTDLLATFADWERAVADVEFQQDTLEIVREGVATRTAAQEEVVARMRKLVDAGTDSPRDLAVEQNNLVQIRIDGRREIREAETALRVARRTESALERQLQQAGLEPDFLKTKLEDGVVLDLVVAEVPEARAAMVRPGMGAEVRFFALPGRTFQANVSSISPVITGERRVLNVQFTVTDGSRVIRPGMFAEVGLGTDERTVLMMPADGVLHIGRDDYALVEVGPGEWRVTRIEVGATADTEVEVVAGLQPGDRVLGKGAILLKPLAGRAIQEQAAAPSLQVGLSSEGGR